jgi:hypothetical protein
MATTNIIVRADHENNAEAFWDALRRVRCHPNPDTVSALLLDVLVRLERDGEAEITDPKTVESLNRLCRLLPGWDDPEAPAYAPHPLLFSAAEARG